MNVNISGFSEIETKKVILDKSGRTEVTIRTPEIQKLRFSFLNFKEITVSDLYAIGQQIYPINIDDIKVVDANISVKNNGFSVYPNGQHGYVVFEKFTADIWKIFFEPRNAFMASFSDDYIHYCIQHVGIIYTTYECIKKIKVRQRIWRCYYR